MENSTVNGFTITWVGQPNANGVKPPNPQFQPAPLPANVLALTSLPDPSQAFGPMPVGLIQSARQPFAVEHGYTKYGELSTGLGTNMGANM